MMASEIQYKLTFKETQIRTTSDNLTFTIGNIKCRTSAVVYFVFTGYDLRGNVVTTHTGDRWVVTSKYSMQSETFTIDNPDDIDTFVIDLMLIGIDSENPLFLNRLMLNEGEYEEYHQPNEEVTNVSIAFNRNHYVNLYDGFSDKYLQIIRPNHESFNTSSLSPSKTTILVPHIPNETSFDDPVALFYEYMYQIEQIIGVEK